MRRLSDVLDCAKDCYSDRRCDSFKYITDKGLCFRYKAYSDIMINKKGRRFEVHIKRRCKQGKIKGVLGYSFTSFAYDYYKTCMI